MSSRETAAHLLFDELFQDAIFESAPSVRLIKDFTQHVDRTGKPDTWKSHFHTKPAKNANFEILKLFEVPTRLRSSVPMATCPICSPNAPKYYHGALVWFCDEGKIRAVGIECARSHFGVAAVEAAFSRKKDKEDEDSALIFLIDNLCEIQKFLTRGPELLAAARVADHLRARLKIKLTNQLVGQLARDGNDGWLKLHDAVTQNKVGRDGRDFQSTEHVEVRRFQIAGLSYLRSKESILAQARNAIDAMSKFPSNEDGFEAFLIDSSQSSYAAISNDLRHGIAGFQRAAVAVSEAQKFFSPENLVSLSEWSSDARSGFRVKLSYTLQWPRRFSLPRKLGGIHEILVPNELFDFTLT
jgi:hypothetical protein